MSRLVEELRRLHPSETYLADWFENRQKNFPWPEEEERWVTRSIRFVERWLRDLEPADPLVRQENLLLDRAGKEAAPEILNFLKQVYPDQRTWAFFLEREGDADFRRNLTRLWKERFDGRRNLSHKRLLAKELPSFHQALVAKIHALLDKERTLRSLFAEREVGWDLENGTWDSLNFAPLLKAAERLEKEKELRRIAELLGRDYRARERPPDPPPVPPKVLEPEPGKSEIQGVTLGKTWDEALSSEAALLAFPETEVIFFKKLAESELLSWDYFTPAPPPVRDLKKHLFRQKRNDRGPIIIVLDTSGSMRGKPEEVAKTLVFALTRVALEEERACYLINFSAQIKTLEVSNLKDHLADLIAFLEFSFHGGTDLPPALKQALRVLEDGAFKDADVLVVSDFSVPKLPVSVRNVIRFHQQQRGTRFYALTVSVRPLNDFLNIFDASWVYNIHPYQVNGIDPATLQPL